MTHAFYDNQERRDLIEKGILLWRNTSENYRTLVIKCKFLTSEKRRRRMSNTPAITAKMAREFPEIKLFRFLNECDVVAFLEDLPLVALSRTITDAENILSYNPIYRTLVARVKEFTYQLNVADRPCSKFGCDPQSRGSLRRVCR